MSAAKTKKAKAKRATAKKAKKATKSVAKRAKVTKPKSAKPKAAAKRAKPQSAAPQAARPFRFTAADTVHIRFPGDKKPESFRVDDMVEATLAALDGQTRQYYQYRLVSNDKTGPDGAERHFWFFDPKPVGLSDPVGPSLWQPASNETIDGHEAVSACSGNFSTRSVTSYDGSGARHVLKLGGTPAYRMRLDLNGKREVCDSLTVTVGKNNVLSVAG
jgi:hypothetical protein